MRSHLKAGIVMTEGKEKGNDQGTGIASIRSSDKFSLTAGDKFSRVVSKP